MEFTQETLEQKISEFNQLFPDLQVNVKPDDIINLMNNLEEYLSINNEKILSNSYLADTSKRQDFITRLESIYLTSYHNFLKSLSKNDIRLFAEGKNVIIIRQNIAKKHSEEINSLLYKIIGSKLCNYSLMRYSLQDDNNIKKGCLIRIIILIIIILLSIYAMDIINWIRYH